MLIQAGVVGLGYVGAVTAACLAKLGHQVYGFEKDEEKIAKLKLGISPFFEPGLDELLSRGLNAGRLHVCSELRAVISELDIVLICVGTPNLESGAHDHSQLARVCEELAAALRSVPRKKTLTVAIRSTVTPGTTEDLNRAFFLRTPNIEFAYLPEFLREGTAIKDFFDPSLLVVGAEDRKSGETALSIYKEIDAPRRILSIRAAEMIKGVCNAFHALKVAFANETGSLAAACGVDPIEVMSVFCADTRLNLSSAYLSPGFPFGGSCLPKDVRALNHLGHLNGMELPLYQAILPSNEEHLHRAIRRVMAAGFMRVGIVGLSFKAETDDMRESPALQLAAGLARAELMVRAFDPDIRAEMLHGANLRAMNDVFSNTQEALMSSLDDLMNWADGLVLTKVQRPEVNELIRASTLRVVDLSQIMIESRALDSPC